MKERLRGFYCKGASLVESGPLLCQTLWPRLLLTLAGSRDRSNIEKVHGEELPTGGQGEAMWDTRVNGRLQRKRRPGSRGTEGGSYEWELARRSAERRAHPTTLRRGVAHIRGRGSLAGGCRKVTSGGL